MRTRTPFYGMPEDAALIGSMGDGSEPSGDLTEAVSVVAGAENGRIIAEAPSDTVYHPNYREIGTEAALGFMPHRGENRHARRAAVATWTPPTVPEGEQPPTRRELWAQRQRQRRGTLDPELRRLQRAKAKTK